jgi:hypothetical protein
LYIRKSSIFPTYHPSAAYDERPKNLFVHVEFGIVLVIEELKDGIIELSADDPAEPAVEAVDAEPFIGNPVPPVAEPVPPVLVVGVVPAAAVNRLAPDVTDIVDA